MLNLNKSNVSENGNLLGLYCKVTCHQINQLYTTTTTYNEDYCGPAGFGASIRTTVSAEIYRTLLVDPPKCRGTQR